MKFTVTGIATQLQFQLSIPPGTYLDPARHAAHRQRISDVFQIIPLSLEDLAKDHPAEAALIDLTKHGYAARLSDGQTAIFSSMTHKGRYAKMRRLGMDHLIMLLQSQDPTPDVGQLPLAGALDTLLRRKGLNPEMVGAMAWLIREVRFRVDGLGHKFIREYRTSFLHKSKADSKLVPTAADYTWGETQIEVSKDPRVKANKTSISVESHFPRSVLDAAIGKNIHEIFGTNFFGDAVVGSVRQNDKSTTFHMKMA